MSVIPPAMAPMAPTACHILSVSTSVRAATAPATIATASAMVLRPLAMFRNLDPLAFPANTSMALDTDVSTSPTPLAGAVRLVAALPNDCKASPNWNSTAKVPALRPVTATAPQLMLDNVSLSVVATDEMKSTTVPSVLDMPLYRPSMMFLPISNITVDGEWMPRTSLIASMIRPPMVVMISTTALMPSPIPSIKPSRISGARLLNPVVRLSTKPSKFPMKFFNDLMTSFQLRLLNIDRISFTIFDNASAGESCSSSLKYPLTDDVKFWNACRAVSKADDRPGNRSMRAFSPLRISGATLSM